VAILLLLTWLDWWELQDTRMYMMCMISERLLSQRALWLKSDHTRTTCNRITLLLSSCLQSLKGQLHQDKCLISHIFMLQRTKQSFTKQMDLTCLTKHMSMLLKSLRTPLLNKKCYSRVHIILTHWTKLLVKHYLLSQHLAMPLTQLPTLHSRY
jgi:hypothetical protein